ncbi:MAG: hypothetical protein E7410_03065 [Ruminococcaceae bacterium]|nr:hypothetical protein [Oscillospiraceae bacterium]
MIIAVQDGLEKLAREIGKYGIKVLMCSECNCAVDAFVYVGDSMPNLPSLSASTAQSSGVFMINAYGKSAGEIVDILNRRTYTPLF